MKLAKEIQAALKAKQKNPSAPDNLFDFTVQGLVVLGYSKLGPEEVFQDGDIIQFDKPGTLFVVLNDAKHYRRVANKNIGTLTVFRK